MKIIFLHFLFFVLPCFAAKENHGCFLKHNDNQCLDETTISTVPATVLLEKFLNIEGKYDPLLNYQQNSIAINSYFKVKDPTPEDLKLILFYALRVYSNSAQDAAASEHLSSEFMKIYMKNKQKLFKILEELPIFIEPTCFYLSNHFGFENTPVKDRKVFWKKNKKKFLQLNKISHQRCKFFFESKKLNDTPYRS